MWLVAVRTLSNAGIATRDAFLANRLALALHRTRGAMRLVALKVSADASITTRL